MSVETGVSIHVVYGKTATSWLKNWICFRQNMTYGKKVSCSFEFGGTYRSDKLCNQRKGRCIQTAPRQKWLCSTGS